MAPLEGLKVVEPARILAGPWAGQTLVHDLVGDADILIENIKVGALPNTASTTTV